VGFHLNPNETENLRIGSLINRGFIWCLVPRKEKDPKPVRFFFNEVEARAAETRKLKAIRTQKLIKITPIN